MFTYFTNFWKQPFRGVLLKSDPEEIRKIHKKASFAETFFSPVKLHDYKEGLRYGCFYDEFLENFQIGFYTKNSSIRLLL